MKDIWGVNATCDPQTDIETKQKHDCIKGGEIQSAWSLVNNYVPQRFISFDECSVVLEDVNIWDERMWKLSVLSLPLFCKSKIIPAFKVIFPRKKWTKENYIHEDRGSIIYLL